MESFEADDLGRPDWGHLRFNKKQVRIRNRTCWNSFVLIAVAFLHIGVLGYLFQWRQIADSKIDALHDALQIDFIERSIEPEPEVESSHVAKSVAAKKSPMGSVTNTSAEMQAIDESNVTSVAKLRLNLDKNEWNAEPVVAERNPLRRQHIVLAGRAEPFIKGIKLHDKLTPEQSLALVAKLFGAVDYDPCEEARRRVASGQSQLNEVDLEADLSKIENHCRP